MLNFTEILSEAKDAISNSSSLKELDDIRVKYIGKKGILNKLIKKIGNLPLNDRLAAGIIFNTNKEQIKTAFKIRKEELEKNELNAFLTMRNIDVSLPGRRILNGNLHPITNTIEHVEVFFESLGFKVVHGPEIEDHYHNFDALNIPVQHPARAKNDTFWFDSKRLLRTQTSSIQIRVMKNKQPPIRIISSGRVYRKDYDENHTPMFHQLEGLIIDEKINFSNLKGTLKGFLFNFFGEDLNVRFRPSYFQFTEPSAEIDIMNKNGKWLEVIGCGMVHPNVMRNLNIDPEIYSGFAFGIGIERLAMLHYNVNDLRIFFENDLRFLKQFK